MQKKKLSLSIKILIGFALGILAGALLRSAAGVETAASIADTWVTPFSTLFLNLVRMVCIPLVFCSLVTGASATGDVKSMGRIGGKTLAWFVGTTVVAGTLAIMAANFLKLGSSMNIDVGTLEYTPNEGVNFIDTIINIIPTNVFAAFTNGNMLQIIATALALGIGINLVGDKANGIKEAFAVLSDIMSKLTGLIMLYCPVAVFAFMTTTIAKLGLEILMEYVVLIGAIYAVCIFQIVAIYFPMVVVLCKYNLRKFITTIWPSFAVAFTTMSSAAALPLTMDNCEELGVSNKVRSFVAPLGCTIHMDGTAVYEAICAIFIANVYGMTLPLSAQVSIVAIATIASVGCAGVPGAGLIMLSTVLAAAGLPADGIAMVVGINTILSPIVTALNVFGDAAVALIIEKSENKHAAVE